MEFMTRIIDIIIHLDRYLSVMIQQFGAWTYLVLFIIIFMETGFVVTPFLPGDSLLFAAGAFAALGVLDPVLLLIVLSIAAVLGDTANYWIGHYLGPRVFKGEGRSRFFKREHLDKTHAFYEKHGGKTIIIARFIPIIRTFAPFVAGVGKMSYWKFISFNVIGGIGWVTMFVLGGYFFGNISFVKKNFSVVVIAIVLISLLPAFFEWYNQRRRARKPGA
jgi:membrane-associated protein